MARLGLFDPELDQVALFDDTVVLVGWFDDDLIPPNTTVIIPELVRRILIEHNLASITELPGTIPTILIPVGSVTVSSKPLVTTIAVINKPGGRIMLGPKLQISKITGGINPNN